jgi:molybdopterin adenylyltransferase
MSSKENKQIRAIVLTVSDSREEKTDVSGVTLVGLLLSIGAQVDEKIIVSDDFENLRQTLYSLAEREEINLIITTGGTGLAERDNTPEATQAVIEREVPGIAEAMRMETLKNTQLAMLSRGVCGVRDNTLIINLPGSPKAVKECFAVIKPVLQHAVNLLEGKTSHQ